MPPSQPERGVILVVDDDIAIREAISDALGDEGYPVEMAVSGADALGYLRSHPAPSLIFLDWNMAPMNAPQFMEELAREPTFGQVPVVLVTADVKAEQKVKTSRFEGVLKKPVDLDRLFALAERFASTRGERIH
jgi:CheY-like chemotaxis protein